MSAEEHSQQQKKKQEPLQQIQKSYQHSSNAANSHSNPQKRHYEQCSCDKDIVCDKSDLHHLKQKHHHSEQGNLTSAQHTVAKASTTKPPCQRKHSHSPHHSHQISPHSHRSHSLHSSPHQSHLHMPSHNYESPAPLRTPTTVTPTPASSSANMRSHAFGQVYSHHSNHRRRRRQQINHHTANGNTVTENTTADASSTSHHKRSTLRHNASCSRRHRSTTDVSSTSLNTCHDHEGHEIFVQKSCCNASSRTELAQYFAEDLYGTSRRPSSCCTSSDYCYQTDSTSLYGSRSSLSRNNSVKSASVLMRNRRTPQRQRDYTSISLRALNASCPNSQLGSLTSMFDRAKSYDVHTVDVKPSLGTAKSVELHRQSSKDALTNDLPEYACSPSPIRWSFLADSKSSTEFEVAEILMQSDTKESKKCAEKKAEKRRECVESLKRERALRRENDQEQVCKGEKSTEKDVQSQVAQQICRHSTSTAPGWPTLALEDRPSTSAAAARKTHENSFGYECEESSTTVLFHQEGEAYNNCCSNYVQCNTYLDQDLQITSEDIHQYLSKGNQNNVGDVLNNSKNYPFQPSNALEFHYKNNFANNNNSSDNRTGSNAVGSFRSGVGCGGTTTASSECGDSVSGYDGAVLSNSSKETNLNQKLQPTPAVPCTSSSCTKSTQLSLANINLSSSTNNINIVFSSVSGGMISTEHNANEVKFINTARSDTVVSSEAHHSGYLPYTYPTYDYTNMSGNPQHISEISKPSEATAIAHMYSEQFGDSGSIYETDHSASIHSPIPTGISFESFDAASEHNLLSQRGSVQYSSPLNILRSPLSPVSMASINPAADSVVQPYHEHLSFACNDSLLSHYNQNNSNEQPVNATDDDYKYHDDDNTKDFHLYRRDNFVSGSNAESFKLVGAIKKVRNRARKYTNFLLKK